MADPIKDPELSNKNSVGSFDLASSISAASVTGASIHAVPAVKTSNSIELNSQINGFGTRGRAGTLPSRFNSPSQPLFNSNPLGFDFISNASSNSLGIPQSSTAPATSGSNIGLSRTPPPGSSSDSSSKDLFSDIFNATTSTAGNSLAAAPTKSPQNLPPVGGRRRMRSGSLFGFDSKIWSTNDVSFLPNADPLDSKNGQERPKTPSSSGISPAIQDFSRIRSYTTTNALNDKQYRLGYDSKASLNTPSPLEPGVSPSNVVQPPNAGYFNYPNQFDGHANPESLLVQQSINNVNRTMFSNVLIDNSRPRSQTYTTGSNGQSEVAYEYYGNQSQKPQAYANQLNSSLSPVSQNIKLVDNADLKLLEFTSTFQTSTLSPSNTIVIMNLPPLSLGISTAAGIYKLVVTFGEVRGVYVFTVSEADNEDKSNINTIKEEDEYVSHSKNVNVCCLVEYSTIENAMRAKASLNHKELHPNYSCIVGFAKITSNKYLKQADNNRESNAVPLNPSAERVENHSPDAERKNLLLTSEPRTFKEILPDLKTILAQLLGYDGSNSNAEIDHMINNAIAYKGSDNDFGPLPEPLASRAFDAPKLREIRKSTDSNQLSQFDMESIALAMYDELGGLSSDYLGNTIVQKLFEVCSEPIKDIMLKKVSPYIAQMGIHKNGTWAGQKIINVANTVRQKVMIKNSLLPHVAPLFKDGFGNYLVQGCLKFGSPYNNFIFEAICSKFWVLAQDRYGSRAIRAVLESGNCTVSQTSLLASLIVAHAEFLAINNNGALLLTWYLDTYTSENRHMVLTKKLLPWLVELSYSKLGSLTILKILNYRTDPRAGDLILKTLFGSSMGVEPDDPAASSHEILKQILKEFTYGPTFIHKTLSTPLVVENNLRPLVVNQIKNVLVAMKITPYQQGYKRLMDEVGLTSKDPGMPINSISGVPRSSRTPTGTVFYNSNNGPRHPSGSPGSRTSSLAPIQTNMQQNRFINPMQQIVGSPQYGHPSPMEFGYGSQMMTPTGAQMMTPTSGQMMTPTGYQNAPGLYPGPSGFSNMDKSGDAVYDSSGLAIPMDALSFGNGGSRNFQPYNKALR